MVRNKIVASLCFALLGVSCGTSKSINFINNNVYLASNLYDDILGFTYFDGTSLPVLAMSNESGYLYYDLDIYYTKFTRLSDLFFVKLVSEFTPGSVAYRNGHHEFDSNYYLYEGYTHMKVDGLNHYDEDRQIRSPGVELKKYFPYDLNQGTATKSYDIIATYGTSLSLSSELSSGADFGGGVSCKSTITNSFTVTYDQSVAITNPDPNLTINTAPNDQLLKEWSYKYAYEGDETYRLTTFLIFEINSASAHGVSPHSFNLILDFYMKNRKNNSNYSEIDSGNIYKHYE